MNLAKLPYNIGADKMRICPLCLWDYYSIAYLSTSSW